VAVAEQIQTRQRATGAVPQTQVTPVSRRALPVTLYFLAIMLPIIFEVGPFKMSGSRLLLLVMIIPLSVQLLMGRFGRILLTDILFFLHWVWVVVVLSIKNPELLVSTSGSTGIEFLGSYILGRAFIRTSADFIGLIKFLAVIALCAIPFAIYETLTGNAFILQALNALPGVSSMRDIWIGPRLGLNRVQLVFPHPIHYGLFCTMALSLCFVGLKGIYSDTSRVLITLAIGASGLLALSSGAFLSLLMQVILIGWAFVFRRTVWRWWLLVGLFVAIYISLSLLSNRPPIRVILTYMTLSSHTAYWRTIIFEYGMISVWANPIFGVGLNDWIRPRWMYSGSVDNFWLLVAMRYGFPGFFLLAGGYLLALWKIGRRDFDSDQMLWRLRRAWMFSFIGLTFTLSTVFVWDTVHSLLFFMFGAGMWMLNAPVGQAAAEPDKAPGRRPAGQRRGAPEPPRGTTAAAASAEAASPVHTGPRYTRFQNDKTRDNDLSRRT
jgi:hypothetical protein